MPVFKVVLTLGVRLGLLFGLGKGLCLSLNLAFGLSREHVTYSRHYDSTI